MSAYNLIRREDGSTTVSLTFGEGTMEYVAITRSGYSSRIFEMRRVPFFFVASCCRVFGVSCLLSFSIFELNIAREVLKGQSKNKQNESKQNEAKQSRAQQSKAVQSRAKQGRAEQSQESRTKHDQRAARDRKRKQAKLKRRFPFALLLRF